MKCYIIRHAEKEPGDFYNPLLRHQDQPISLKGREESQRLLSFFAEKQIAKIYISAYIRTRQTIEDVAQYLHIVPIMDDRLNEIDNGLLDGLSDQAIQQRYPDTWADYQARSSDFRFPEGETGAEALQRIVSVLEEKRTCDEDIILVTHEGLIRLLLCYVLGIPVYWRWNFHVDTCGIMEIEYQPTFDTWKLIRFNHQYPPHRTFLH